MTKQLDTANDLPFDGDAPAVAAKPAKRSRKAAAPKADVAPVAVEFKSTAAIAEAQGLAKGLLTAEQLTAARRVRSLVGGKMGYAFLLGIDPK